MATTVEEEGKTNGKRAAGTNGKSEGRSGKGTTDKHGGDAVNEDNVLI